MRIQRNARSRLAAVLALVLALTVSPTAAQIAGAEATGEPVRFNFADSFSGTANLRVLGDVSAVPITRKQSYGASVSATGIGQSRSFEFDVPASGIYLVSFQGYLYFSSGIADLIVDGEKIGTYDFYDPGSTSGPLVPVKSIELTEGTHTFTLLVSGRNPDARQTSNYSLYPTQFTLTPQDGWPALELNAAAKPMLLIGETVNVGATLRMSDGTPIPAPTYEYASSDPAVATVDAEGNVTGVGDGAATITVIGRSGESTLEKQLSVEVTDATLASISVDLDTPELGFGESGRLLVTGTMSDGMAADLSDSGITYESDAPGTVAVDAEGMVTAIRPGEANITARVTFVNTTMEQRIRIMVSDQIPNAKTRPTVYTEEKVLGARENIENFDWAKAERDAAVESADRYLRNGLDFLWNIVPPQSLPRSYGVNQIVGSPITGREIDKYGNYPYVGDPYTDPWKIVDPSSGYKFPTNDFASFYQSGIDDNGVFHRELADEQYLVNELYPEKGPTWGVDDGFGWVDDNGNRFTFVAYYVHWFLWYGSDSVISNANVALRNAFLYTGDMKYARAGIVLLDRIADMYPHLDVAAYDPALFLNSHGGLNTGKTIGSQWEELLIREYIYSYDAYFPAFDDPETIAFLNAKAEQHDLDNPKNSASAIKRNIEDGIVRQAMPAVQKAQIYSVNGRHANVLTQAAVVFDTLPETKDWLDFAFRPGGLTPPPRQVTGGDILPRLVEDVDRDGAPSSGAPEYNLLWLARYIRIAETLDGYDKYPAADLFENVKFKKLFSTIYPLILSERYVPTFGDSKKTGDPGIFGVNVTDMVTAFKEYEEPIFAQMAYFLNGNTLDGLNVGMFSTDPGKTLEDIGDIIEKHGELDLKSDNLTGYGFAALRDGRSGDGADAENTLRDLWMYYGRNTGHGHKDTLNIGLHAFDLDLSPDLGYPEFADNRNMNRFQWVNNTISHNTVIVDEAKQGNQWVATPKHFDDTEQVKLLDVEAPQVYPETDLYKRTTAMIKVDDANSYAVDFFRVRGGNSHHFSFHGAEGTASAEGVELHAQQTGSYAGPDVEFGQRVDSVEGHLYQGHGFHWLKNVERSAAATDAFSVDWSVNDTWNVYGNGAGAETDVHLRLTMVGDVDEVALADGVPPQNKEGNPEALRYLIAKRTGENLDSVFTSVIEPYKGSRFIESVEQVSVTTPDGDAVTGTEARAVRVQLKNGRTDYVVSALDPSAAYEIDGRLAFQGFFGVYSEEHGEPVHGYLNEGTTLGDLIQSETAALTGTVTDFTKELSLENEITIQLDQAYADIENVVGSYVYVETDGERNGAYRIQSVKAKKNNKVALDIGDVTLIRNYNNASDVTQGFRYDIAEGAAFVLPLSVEAGTGNEERR